MKRTSLKKVSKKRAKANAEYSKRRKAFLEAHPFCQWWIRQNFLNEYDVIANNGHTRKPVHSGGIPMGEVFGICPRSTDIHHMRKPRATYLNDESTWMAVSRDGHQKIHDNPRHSYEVGYMLR